MYYSNSTRTAVEVVSELIDELDDSKWEQQAAESCKEVLRLLAESPSLSGTPNPSIMMHCREKSLYDWAVSVVVLLRRSHREAQESGYLEDAIRFTCAEGMMWGAAAMLSMAELQSRQNHPSEFN